MGAKKLERGAASLTHGYSITFRHAQQSWIYLGSHTASLKHKHVLKEALAMRGHLQGVSDSLKHRHICCSE